MKIVTNVQNKDIGGIVRYMNIFLDEVRNFPVEVVLSSVYNSPYEKTISNWSVDSLNSFKRYSLVTKSNYYNECLEKSSSFSQLKLELSQLVEKYIEILEKEKPDVVLINGTYYRPWCLMTASRRLNIPFVVVYHGSIVQESRGLDNSKVEIMKAMELDFYNERAVYIFPSRISLEASFLYSLKKDINVEIIPNPIDKIFVDDGTKSSRSNKVGFVLRWEKIKNTDFILDFVKLNDQSASPYEIEILTDKKGQEEIGNKYKSVKILTPLQGKDMKVFYSSLGILINPSHFETFGYAPAEAVVVGIPALVSEKQGISEIFLKSNLERLIVKFDGPKEVHSLLPDLIKKGVSEEERSLLLKELSPVEICKKILKVLLSQTN